MTLTSHVASGLHNAQHSAPDSVVTQQKRPTATGPQRVVARGIDALPARLAAKGGKPVSDSVRSLADVVVVWAAKVSPAVITLENVPEFADWGPLDKEGKPNREKRGQTFRRWKGDLEALGYAVEWKVLHAHHFGAPTSRKRLFLVARNDGEAIQWPAPTHGPGLKPYRTAAECIDFSIPGKSIFGRTKDLAEATHRRVATGFVEFVLHNPRPYIVTLRNHVAPRGDDQPLTTVSAQGNHHARITPILVQTGYGEREGQKPRTLDIQEPLGTVVGCGQKHALSSMLLAPFISQFYGGQVGHEVEKPLPTVTAILGFACAGDCAATLWEREVLGKTTPLEEMFVHHSQACIVGQVDFEPCICRPPAFVGAA